jgi:hypothetical protein
VSSAKRIEVETRSRDKIKMRFMYIPRCVITVDSNVGMIMHRKRKFVQFCFDWKKKRLLQKGD